MSALGKRVSVSFSADQIDRLEAIARARGQSVGALIRKAVEEAYLRPGDPGRLEAVRLMAEMRLPVADSEEMERESVEGCAIGCRDPLH
jgi:hypothetical protein